MLITTTLLRNLFPPRDSQWSWTKAFVPLAVIAGAGFLAFFPSLQGYFIWDDYLHLEKASSISLSNFWKLYTIEKSDAGHMLFWWSPPYRLQYLRPLASVLTSIDYACWHLEPAGFHVTNLVLHLLTAMLVYFAAVALLGYRTLPLFVALLFCLHPCHTEAVSWLSGRADLLVCFFSVASLLSFILYKRSADKKRLFYGLSLISLVLALASKESAVTTAMLLIVYDFLDSGSRPVGHFLKERLKVHLPFLVTVGLYVVFRLLFFPFPSELPDPYFFPPTHPEFMKRILQNTICFASSLLLLSPISTVDSMLFSAFPVLYVIAAAIVLSIVVPSIYFLRMERLAYFFIFWTAVTFIPVISMQFYQRFLYLPSVGACFFVGLVIQIHLQNLEEHPEYTRGIRLASLGILCVYLSLCLATNVVFRDISYYSKSVIRQVKEEVQEVPKGAKFYFVNIEMPAGTALDSALRVMMHEPTITTTVLTLAPRFIPTHTELSGNSPRSLRFMSRVFPHWTSKYRSYVQPVDEYRLKVGLEKGVYLGSGNRQIRLSPTRSLVEGDVVRCRYFEAQITRFDEEGLKEVVFRFTEPIAAPGQFFFLGRGWDVERLRF